MGLAFSTQIDVANRVMQKLGAKRIFTLNDNSKNSQEVAFVLDKIRAAEMRRRVWRFGIKRAALRAATATTKRFVAPAWAVTTSYSVGQLVQDSTGLYWVCMVANTASAANAPGQYTAGQPQYWQQWFGNIYGDVYSASTTYYAGELVYTVGTPDVWYLSLINANVGHTPVSSATDWAPLNAASDLIYPQLMPIDAIGTGSVTLNTYNQYIFYLPAAFLRMAPNDPKTANTPNLVTSGGLPYKDWSLEGHYLVSGANTGPIITRHIADMQDVGLMDPLFCEAWASRGAFELCETITGSTVRKQALGQEYTIFMKSAVQINRIELGSTEEAEEEFDLTTGPSGVAESIMPAGVGGGGELSAPPRG